MQRTYEVKLTGQAPLLMHADNLDWRAQMERWQLVPDNKKSSKAGDDRTPAFRWIGNVYHDGRHVGIPADNLMTCIREGGARVPIGKGQTTFKRQSQSGIVVNEVLWPILGANGLVKYEHIAALKDITDFHDHEEACATLGFVLFSKSAKVGQSKHVRVRPRFDVWATGGTVIVFDDTITTGILQSIFDNAGRYCGLGDWRPSSPKSPGSWGTFTAKIKEV